MTRTRTIRTALAALVLALIGILIGSRSTRAQQNVAATPVTLQTVYPMIAISSTAAVATQTTLTIPAPPPTFYNYVCTMHYSASQNGTATANQNLATTSTNFNAWALKYSLAATANLTYDWYENWTVPNVGCAKSTSPGTATTFVSPAGQTNTAFTWSATYYQAP